MNVLADILETSSMMLLKMAGVISDDQIQFDPDVLEIASLAQRVTPEIRRIIRELIVHLIASRQITHPQD